ncbi:MAG: biotin--[acetyl-CoA-carboxylase] ligase [Candidatus Thermoplasmatota archaeon]|nr:biotin--[acetyl-CoA-carboxylase] ligase [Candidatus Thermoplasmatota archaeon]
MTESAFVKKTKIFSHSLQADVVKNLLAYDEIESTNSTAKQLASAGAEHGTVVLAKTQSQGRGRFDRTWESPEGGVYLSIILRPQVSAEQTSLLAFVAGLAVAHTIRSYGLPAMIKWPNDVRVHHKKIAGMLLESELVNQTVTFLIVGVGINLNIESTAFSNEIQSQSTSVAVELGSPVEFYEFLTRLLLQFDTWYQQFLEKQYDQILSHWKTASDTLGKPVRIQTKGDTLEGIAIGIDKQGFLRLQTKRGETKTIMSGDCLYLRET